LEKGQVPYEKPESGRFFGPKGSPRGLLGRLGGRGKVRPSAKNNLFFAFCLLSRFFPFFDRFFVFLPPPLVS
jgi:hypothetical protein